MKKKDLEAIDKLGYFPSFNLYKGKDRKINIIEYYLLNAYAKKPKLIKENFETKTL